MIVNSIFFSQKERVVSSNPRPILFSLYHSPTISDQSSRQISNRRTSGIKRRSTNSITTKGKRRSSGKSRGVRNSEDDQQIATGDFLDNSKNGLKNEEEGDTAGSNCDESGSIKRFSNDHHVEKCAADSCLNPYSEYINI